MSVQRIIPVLLHKNGRFILSRSFETHHDIGGIKEISGRLKSWDLDELIILDITPHWNNAQNSQSDKKKAFQEFCRTISEISQNCFVPLSVGGGIQSTEQVHQLMRVGADRVVLNSALFNTPGLINDIAIAFGSQAVITGIDAKREQDDSYTLHSCGGKKHENITLEEWITKVQRMGAGEILIQSIDRDGKACGYDNELIKLCSKTATVPLIICGGAGSVEDFSNTLRNSVKAVAAANIFNFTELSYKCIKDSVENTGISLRPSSISIDYVAEKIANIETSRFNTENEEIWKELSNIGFME